MGDRLDRSRALNGNRAMAQALTLKHSPALVRLGRAPAIPFGAFPSPDG